MPSVEMGDVETPQRPHTDFDAGSDSGSDDAAATAAPAEPFSWGTAFCWSSAAIVCTLAGWVYAAVAERGCEWAALVFVPPLFIAYSIFFLYFVVEKRSHRVLCCFHPDRWTTTGWMLIGVEIFTLMLTCAAVVKQGTSGNCSHSSFWEWIAVTAIGCVLLLSVLKDIFVVLPAPTYAQQL
eukprot:Rhum_TRINITY_DN2895_c0_g1::Rhum_TRINITY_DN2895_c0_g1_i1::g.8436::m.8436